MPALVSSSFRRDDSRRRRKERDTCSTDKCTKMTSSEKKKKRKKGEDKMERRRSFPATRRVGETFDGSISPYTRANDRERERERERKGRGGELTAATRENHLQNRRATVLFPCSRLRPFNVNGAGNREYRGNRIFHGEKWTATMKKGEKYRSLRNWLFHGTRRIYFSYYADVGQNHAGFHPLWTLFIMKKKKKKKREKIISLLSSLLLR